MEFGDSEEVLRALDDCLSRIKWRLRSSAKRRLEIDILSLLTGLRPVVMVDYGGKMPELGEHLCALLHLARKETTIFLQLKIMVIEDMIYIIHVKGLAEHTSLSLNFQPQLFFVDLEQDPPKMILHSEQNAATLELVAIQKKFASLLPSNEDNAGPSLPNAPISTPKVKSSDCDPHGYTNAGESFGFESSEPIDLSDIVKDTKITLPTLNGWLLGYPVVYLFSKDHVADAVYNLSTKYLHIYKILVRRKEASGRKSSEEELMSFTVPYELSQRADKEPWAEMFLTCISAKLESCRRVWMHLRMEVSECYPQAIVL
ncbi:uncharacterized protein LOC120259013 isoform X1 [Dioscorea cayenensis subsp. rotundata]|uniref:Uncharacterized protein LOC120259013 isoform X1 n=1 Tax=Dioscorea cayennensis subsp. rotundata TaxID=55577 RepID=A0AB40B6Y0_DIOCR|nr:uncharacterized protein LOC120259013 isoform X1 [Dioscorea cayenensis subsp. rotundata]